MGVKENSLILFPIYIESVSSLTIHINERQIESNVILFMMHNKSRSRSDDLNLVPQTSCQASCCNHQVDFEEIHCLAFHNIFGR